MPEDPQHILNTTLLMQSEAAVLALTPIIAQKVEDYGTQNPPSVNDGSVTLAKWATDAVNALAAKAPLASPAFTGTPTGITKGHVGLGSVDNTADSAKPVSTAQQAALDGKAASNHNHDALYSAIELFKSLQADASGGNVNTAQPWFPSAGAVGLAADSTYFFEGLLLLDRTAGTTSHTTSLLFGGTATLASIAGQAYVNAAQTFGNEARNGTVFQVATATVVKAASTTAAEKVAIHVTGTVRVTNAGTFIPQFQYSAAPGGAPTVKRNSYFRLWKIGNAAVVSGGTWS